MCGSGGSNPGAGTSSFGAIRGAGGSADNQRYRASGLNPVVAAIVLWNTVDLERAVQALRDSGRIVDDTLLRHLSPLGWEHINLTGDYIWHQSRQVEQGELRPLRVGTEP